MDIDDAVWFPTAGKSGSTATVNEEFGRRLLAASGLSRFAVAGNEYLADWLRQNTPDTPVYKIFPSLDLKHYQKEGKNKTELSGAKVRIGWIGSEGNLRDLLIIKDVLKRITLDFTADLVIISSKMPDGFEDFAIFVQWEPDRDAALIQDLHIGIMPLEDNPRNMGRCGYKMIQYMAAGLPVISSAQGAAIELVQEGVNGFLCRSDDEWYRALQKLILDSPLRIEMGLIGRQSVEQFCDAGKNAEKILQLLKKSSAA